MSKRNSLEFIFSGRKDQVISYDIIRKMICVVEQAEFWDGGWTYVSGSTSKNG